MAVAGDTGVFATGSRRTHPLLHSSSKVEHCSFPNGRLSFSEISPKRSSGLSVQYQSKLASGITGGSKMSLKSVSQDAETFLLNAINMNFFERLNLAWKIIFPPPRIMRSSNAMIAKQRLKMILFSDRCEVSEEAKRRIVKSIVSVLSDFVEIESQENVNLSVSTDMHLGTLYSVTVPVRRVKPEYQEVDEAGSIMNVEYKDDGETSGSVDVRFDFYVPD